MSSVQGTQGLGHRPEGLGLIEIRIQGSAGLLSSKGFSSKAQEHCSKSSSKETPNSKP